MGALEELIESLPEDKYDAAKMIADWALRMDLRGTRFKKSDHKDAVRFLAFLESFLSEPDFRSAVPTRLSAQQLGDFNAVNSEVFRACQTTLSVCKRVHLQRHFEAAREEFGTLELGKAVYSLTTDDVARIQALINELRDLIGNCVALEEKHRRRLLRKLEVLQSELHEKMSSLDKVWTFMGEFGAAMYKLGNDAKPMVDRAREIAEIVWRSQSVGRAIIDTAKDILQLGSSEDIKK